MTTKNQNRSLRWVLTLIAAAGLAFGQAQPTRIMGTIIGPDGSPVNNATIEFTRTDTPGNYSVETDGNGQYDYATLPPGVYTVQVMMDGAAVYTVNNISTDPAQPRDVSVNMQELMAEQPGGACEAEDVQCQAQAAEEAAAQAAALNEAYNLGMRAKEQEAWDIAIENLAKAAAIDAEQVAIWGNLAQSYDARAQTRRGEEKQADLEAAVNAWSKASALAPTDPAYFSNYGLALGRAGNMDEAEAALNQAATLNPGGGGSYFYNLGVLHFNANRFPEAATAFERAVELQPDHIESWFQLGTVKISLATADAEGNLVFPEGTQEALEKYLELAPNGANVDAAKGMLSVVTGN